MSYLPPQRALIPAFLLVATWCSIAIPQPGPIPSRCTMPARTGLPGAGVPGNAVPGARWSIAATRLQSEPWGPATLSGVSSPTPAAASTGISDGEGGAIVELWNWEAGAMTLRVQRVDALGLPLWGTRGVLLTDSGWESVEPVMAPDGSGGVVIAWTEAASGSGTSQVLVQRVSADGVPQWAPGGVLLTSNADASLADPAIVAAFGGAIVAWVDRGGYSPTDIYAQRVDASGVVRWATNGLAVCTAFGMQSEPAIVASGNGGALITWTDTRNGPWKDLYAQRLGSGGIAQWNYDGVVVCAVATDKEAPAIVTDGANGAIVTWSDPRNGTYDVFAQRLASDGGTPWGGDGRPVCMAVGTQRKPLVAADGAAGAVVAWEDSRNGNVDVCAQHVLASGDTAWTPAVPVCMADGDQSTLALAWDGASGAFVAWVDTRGGYFPEVYVQRVNAAGVPQWATDGIVACEHAVAAERAAVVADGSGGAIVTWEEHRTFDLEIYGQRLDAGGIAQWSPEGAGVLTDPGVQRYPAQVGDGASGTIVALQQKMGGVYKVYLRRYGSTGLALWPWVAACTAPGGQLLPALAADGAGGAVVTWVDARTGLGDAEIYVQKVSASGTRTWEDQGVALSSQSGLQFQPAIVSDGAGGAIVTWMDSPWGGDIFARRIDAAGVPQWAGAVSLCSAPGAQAFPDNFGRDVIVSDGVGGAIVAWYDWRNGADANVYSQRVDAAGTPLWPADGVAICMAAGDQYNVVVTSDGTGGAFVAWEDQRSGMPAIYSQRVNPNGVAQWAADGTTLSGTTYAGMSPRILPDGAAGALVSWTGYASPTTGLDIFAQRINSSGARLWSPRDGRALCLASGTQRDAVLASDGASGAIVAWLDFRAGEGLGHVDLYAQRILANGTNYWSYNGVPLCTHPDAQFEPVMIPDGSHGVIAAWQDRRDNGMDFIHVQRLDAVGNPRWNDDATVDAPARGPAPAGLAISSVLPNPVRREMTVSFSLPRDDAAELELLDVAGRRILSQPMEAPGLGPHSVRLAMPPETAPGVYMLRVVQAGQASSRKVCVLH